MKEILKILWKYRIFRFTIYISPFVIFMFFCERSIFDEFLRSLFLDDLAPLITNIVTDKKLSEWIVKTLVTIVATPIVIMLCKKDNKRKDDSLGTQ